MYLPEAEVLKIWTAKPVLSVQSISFVSPSMMVTLPMSLWMTPK